jgi:uncharacterized protein (TIGR03000 family)
MTIMRQWLKMAAGGALGLLGFAATHLPDSRAEIIDFNGGFVYSSPAGDRAPAYAPRYEPPPPMRFPFASPVSPSPATPYGNPRGTSGYRSNTSRSYYWGPEPGSAKMPAGPPEKYSLEVSTLARQVPAEERDNVVVLLAQLPEDATLWVEGVPTRATGRTRYFESPPLPPGKKYRYAVKAVWREDGRWVGQRREFIVRAGEMHRIRLTASVSRHHPPAK